MDTQTSEIEIPTAGVRLNADIVTPAPSLGVVVFAHGSGSSRHSPRNRAVADLLNRRAMTTVLVDLLTEDEERVDIQTAELRFDIGLLSNRLVGIIDWLKTDATAAPPSIGLFGASTGAAAALVAAATRPGDIPAVVSRGGRPDLAGPALTEVRAATLLLVGGLDEQVLELNRQALAALPGVAELRVIPGATHLFEEPGTLERVANEAAEWFLAHLPG